MTDSARVRRVVPPAPQLSRRHAAGSGSARGLLFTVLGEFVLPTGGSAWTSAFIDVLGRLGVEEKAARQALMRTAADGWLESERLGRRTRWTLTPAAERLLTEGTERIYSFSGATQTWDGRWLLVLARSPETERPSRHLVRTRLTWAGFGSPAPGVWISTHPERLGEAAKVLADAGLADAQIFEARHAGGGDLAEMVREAWDLAEIDGRYGRFLIEFNASDASDPLARLAQLVHAWRKFPAIDPALPRELLPGRWSGVRAADLFRRRHDDWAEGAHVEWERIGCAGA
jgi:phenylacetic acid degradation operon negative regulatory protein